VTVAPDSALATSLGDTLVFRALARNGRGDSVEAGIDWRTPDAAIVDLRQDGRAIALAVGTARVIATVGSLADTGLAKVTNVPTTIDIQPASRIYWDVGDVDTLPVTITNARGASLPRGSVTWSSDDATIARVSTSGVVTARDTGQTIIRATSGLVTDSVLVTVQNLPASIVIGWPAVDTLTAIGQSLMLPTDVRNGGNLPIPNFPVAWRSTDRTVIDTVLPTGEAVAVGYGTTILIAQAGDAADTVTLTVRNPRRIYVNNAPIVGPRFGTSARPYARIQDGVNAADAADTVLIMRGVGPYSESVALKRRITLLGDSAWYLQMGRSPSAVPQLAHDTGTAAISANTTAPVTVKYLTVRHSLDGPAFASDGSDVQLEYFHVNPPGGYTTRTGRGISVRNSSSGTILRHLSVYSVRGYGISLAGTSAALITDDTIFGVDSIGVPERGAGISLEGGSGNMVQSNVIRSTHGPRILVRGAASANIENHTFSGRHPLVHLDSVTGLVRIYRNTFQVGYDGNDWYDSPDCSVDTRCAGILITDSRNGALVGGYSTLSFTSPAEIAENIFYNVNYPTMQHDGVGIRVRRSMAYSNANNFRYVQTAHYLEGISKGYFVYSSVDTSGFLAVLQDADSVYFGNATTHAAGAVTHFSEAANSHPFIQMSYGRFSRPEGNIFNVWDQGARMLIEDAQILAAPNNQPIVFHGTAITLYRVTVRGVGDTVPGYQAGAYYSAGVMVLNASTIYFYQSRIEGFVNFPGLALVGSITDLSADGNVITRNRTGIYVHSTVPGSAALQGLGNNSVFDNIVGGLEDTRPSSSGLPQWWWGDNRGPRRGTNPAATGDSVISGPIPTLFLTVPPQTGYDAGALRHVRGTGQTAARGTTLPKAFTVRVVDNDGLQVGGVSVTFTVTGGGGNLGGLTTRTVATGSDGLAEVTLTLGPVAGTNTVTATVAGLNTVIFTATGT
jgi:hypothetical protein